MAMKKNIGSDYRVKEGDNNIIYLQKAYDDYEYMIVGQFFKDEGRLIVEVRNKYWDYFEVGSINSTK